MTSQTKKLINDALELPLQMRALLAEKLIESLDEEKETYLSVEWKSEIDRRCQEIEDHTIALIDSEKVFQNAFKVLE